jgi:hypothetical protein
MTDLLFPVSGVQSIPSDLAGRTVVAHHYLHRRPPISFAFGLWDEGRLVGVVTYGVPASRHSQKSVCPSDPDKAVELNRLWVHDDMPRNTESQFVAQSLRHLPPRLVFSYADTAAGHLGYIYRALNFHYAGWTDMDRKTPRFDYVPNDATQHSREASRSGRSGITVRRKPKVRYWTTTGNRAERRLLASLCGWPSLSWTDMPVPVGAA